MTILHPFDKPNAVAVVVAVVLVVVDDDPVQTRACESNGARIHRFHQEEHGCGSSNSSSGSSSGSASNKAGW